MIPVLNIGQENGKIILKIKNLEFYFEYNLPGVSITDNAWDFYSQNRGSIPLRRTSYASMGELVDPADLKSAA